MATPAEQHRPYPSGELNETQHLLVARLLLGDLRAVFPDVEKILYPGCKDDQVLEGVFNKITYVDAQYRRGGNNFVLGDIANTAFPDGSFDAAFIQDLHLFETGKRPLIEPIIRLIRPEGLLIYSKKGCGVAKFEIPKLNKNAQLEPVSLAFARDKFAVFRVKAGPRAV